MLGKEKPRAGRDWCKRHGIALRPDGKVNWAHIDDVRRAIEGLPTAGAVGSDESARVAAAVARITKARR